MDVRLNPISRKKGFSKTKLSEALGQHGIRYVHLRELGNPKENRDGFWDTYTPAWEAARENYRCMLDSEAAREALSYVEELARVEPAVGLMCFERSECNCHRDVILQRIKQQELAPHLAPPNMHSLYAVRWMPSTLKAAGYFFWFPYV